jgi:Tol biopolymer transport system component
MTSAPTEHPLTEAGTIMGTFQYMAPEQLEGIEADARTDIFALGSILYEMATGKPPFAGKGRASLIAAIIEREPVPISTLQPLTPPALERVTSVCLKKRPDDRWQTAHDVKLGLDWIQEGGSVAGVPAPVAARRKSREKMWWAVAAVLMLAMLAAGWVAVTRGRALKDKRKIIASIHPPEESEFETFGSNIGALTLSPDGHWMTFVASSPDEKRRLYLRPLNSGAAQPLAGTEGAVFPFWSPDSRQIGFFTSGKLKKIDRNGGAAITICEASDGRGGTWNGDNVILFAPDTQSPLHRVSAGGGRSASVTTLELSRNETTHRFPWFLPDGEHYLYTRASHALPSGDDGNGIWVGSLGAEEPQRIMQSASNALYANGHLFYVRDRFLMAIPFSSSSQELTGNPFAVGEKVAHLPGFFRGAFAVSENGMVAFNHGFALDSKMTWMDRQGKVIAPLGDVAQHDMIRLSPDGKKLATTIIDPSTGTGDLWVYDIARQVKSRLTFSEMNDQEPIWSPDGTQIVYQAAGSGIGDMFIRPANGTEDAELLYGTEQIEVPQDWSKDGKYILFDHGAGKFDVWVLPMEGDKEPYPLVEGPFDEGYARFSPDGKWVAYISNESGKYEMYATRFPSGEGKWQLSVGGADWAIGWKDDGSEIYYLNLQGAVVKVGLSLGDDLVADLPEEMFPTLTSRTYASTTNGERFIIGVPEAPVSTYPITLIINWQAE